MGTGWFGAREGDAKVHDHPLSLSESLPDQSLAVSPSPRSGRIAKASIPERRTETREEAKGCASRIFSPLRPPPRLGRDVIARARPRS